VSRSTILAVALSMTWPGPAAGTALEGLLVVEIAFSPPSQPIPSARLAPLVALRTGAPLSMDLVRRTIQTLFATGRYSDIQVDATRSGDGVKVTFITVENWFIGSVRVLGVKEPPTPAQLVNATKLELGQLFLAEKVEAGKESLRRLLGENGFHQVSIEADSNARSDTQQIDIVYQVQTGERARFGEIRLAGRPDLSLEQARQITGWSTLKRFTQPAVQRGLERLRRHYQRNDRLQAQVRLEEQRVTPAADRIDLTLYLDPGPRVEVAISGAKLSRRQLRRYVPIYEEGTVDRDLLAEGARNLQDHFQTQGYFDAKVDQDVHQEPNGPVVVEFQGALGVRHRLVKLEIAGNRFFDEATLRERMLLQPASLQYRRGRFSDSLLRGDEAVIQELYRSNGFRSARLRSTKQDDYLGKPGDLAVLLNIEEGPQALVSGLKISGNQAIRTEAFAERLSSLEGQPFSEFNVASDRDQILAQYFAEGFPDASLEWKYTVQSPEGVELEYAITEGRRQFVNQIHIDGFQRTKEAVLRRQIGLYPGEPLSPSTTIDSVRGLYSLGVLSRVNTAVQNPDGAEGNRNVLFQVEEARRWTFGFGGGAEVARLGSQRAPAGEAGFSPRVALEVTRLNLLGRAYTLSFRGQASRLQQRGVLSFQAPRWRGRERLALTFSSLYDDSRNVGTFSANRLEGALLLQHRLTKPTTLFYRYSYRRVKVDARTLNISPQQIPLESQAVRVGLLSGSLVQDRRDDPLESRRGIYNTIDIGLAAGATGSEADFLRILMQNSTYHPLSRRVVLARTTQFGELGLFGSREIPLPERFFSGGSSYHRGFSINQAGPRDLGTGFPMGGNALLLNSIELRGPVRGDDIGGVLFHDAGNVFSGPRRFSFRVKQRGSADFDYMVHAVGVGVRYRTPVGPVRLDLAYAFNPPSFLAKGVPDRLSRFQFHFSLGQTF